MEIHSQVWAGGVYERLIGIIKRTLRVIVENRIIDRDRFRTLLNEIAAVVNERPLCYITKENLDFVRPRDLLMQQNASWIVEHVLYKKYEIENKDTRDQIAKNWTKNTRIITHF